MKHLTLPSLLVLTAIGLVLTGCGSTEPTPTAKPAGSNLSEHPSHDGHGDHIVGTTEAEQTDMEKMKAALAEMDPDDAASAEKQHMCPVSGEMLGTMGVPEKVTVSGQTVWICCDGCKDKLLAEPDKYLAKLHHAQ